MSFTYEGKLLATASAFLDPDSLVATISPPEYYEGKKSAYSLILNRLYLLMCRKGASRIECIDSVN